MTDPKLDPVLADLVEHPEAAPPSVAVMVALDIDPHEPEFASLEAAGLHRRSVVGDVVTGSIAVEDLPRLAAVACVVAVQGGGALAPDEPGSWGG
jgi:hypothetical protein